MNYLILLLFGSFFGMCMIGIPIGVSLTISSLLICLIMDIPLVVVIQQMYAMLDSYTLLAIPLFLLVGVTMDKGGVTDRLILFSRCCVGHIRGGIGHVNVVANMVLSGISGSGTAEAAALGSVMIPAMMKEGYSAEVSAAINAAAATEGPIIPPSIMMVVYGAYGNVSIGALFLGGCIPGVVVGVALMAVVYYWAVKDEKILKYKRATLVMLWDSTVKSFFALIVPFVIIGGVVSGYFTATESAMVAEVFSLIVCFLIYRSLKFSNLRKIFEQTLLDMSAPLFCVAGAGVFGYVMAYLQVPDMVVQLTGPIAGNPILTLLFITTLFLVLGSFMDSIPAIVIFLPIVQKLSDMAHLDPLHVGVLVTIVLCFGLITPPYGLTLLLSAGLAKCSVTRVIIVLLPIYGVFLFTVFLFIFFPEIILCLPRLLMPEIF
jgi:tripartite ATP-independent transporter DctM subunit